MRSQIKTITETRQIEVYLCEVCNQEFDDAYGVKWCEGQHVQEKCQHNNKKHSVNVDLGWECSDCSALDSEESFNDKVFKLADNQDFIKELVNLVNKYGDTNED